METNFITPIQLWGSIEGINTTGSAAATTASDGMFRSILGNAIQDVRDTERNHQRQQDVQATGQSENPETVQIAASEAQLTTSMLVQLRNKALDSYNELMRISL